MAAVPTAPVSLADPQDDQDQPVAAPQQSPASQATAPTPPTLAEYAAGQPVNPVDVEAAIDAAIEADDLVIDDNVFKKASEQIANGKKFGVKF